MTYRKSSKARVLFLLGIAVVAAVAIAFFAYKTLYKKATSTTGQPNASNGELVEQPTAEALKPAIVETNDFTYQKPEDWAKLAKERLDATGATSGIGHPFGSPATFLVKVASSTPRNNTELNSETLAELKKLTNFELLSSINTKVDGKSGQKFTYTFNDANGNKIKQEMSVIVYKQKTFFLLFSSNEVDFDKPSADFAQILTSFKFK